MGSPDRMAEFEAFDSEHPEVYRLLQRLLRRSVRGGDARVSMSALWERMKWDIRYEQRQPSHPVLDETNDFSAEYLAALQGRDPTLAGLVDP